MLPPEFKVRSDPYTYDVVTAIVKRLSQKEDKLLDIGCGSGAFLYMIKDSVNERYGCDFNIEQYAEKENVSHIQKFNLITEEFPYKSENFDIVTCLDVLEHILNPFDIVEQALRVVKPGGYFIISTPNVENFIQRITFFLTGKFKGFWDKKHNLQLGERHLSPIFKDTLLHAIENKAVIAEETFNRTIIPTIRIELQTKNLFLSETVIWVIQKNK